MSTFGENEYLHKILTMTWLTFLSTLLKAVGAAVAFSFGRKVAEDDISWQTDRKALQEANKGMKRQEEVRTKYAKLKSDTPNDWDSVNRLRAGQGAVSKTPKA